MKIVRFRDGRFAVRKWSWAHLEYRYLDKLVKNEYWRPLNKDADYHYKCNTERIALQAIVDLKRYKLMRLADKGTPV